MNELKFKLKKDGKCVGYMRIVNGEVVVRRPFAPDWGPQYRDRMYDYGAEKDIEFDSIHPLVCQDRDGKDCYQGDNWQWKGADCSWYPGTADAQFWFVTLKQDSSSITLLPDEAKR